MNHFMKIVQVLFIITFYTTAIKAESKIYHGLSLKGGLWGIPGITQGQYKSDLENKIQTDNLFLGRTSTFDLGFFNNQWKNSQKFHIFNQPIGLEYSLPVGKYGLSLGIEYRNLFNFENSFKHKPFQKFEAYGNDYIQTDNKNAYLTNWDTHIGFKMPVDNFIITPKLYFRRFENSYKQTSFLNRGERNIYYNKSIQTISWISFIGIHFLYELNEDSSLSLELGYSSPLMGQISSGGNYQKIHIDTMSTSQNMMYSVSNPKQKITGSRFRGSYLYKLNEGLKLEIGYMSENYYVSYSDYSEVPRYIQDSTLNIAIAESMMNQFIYSGITNMKISSFFIGLEANVDFKK